MGRRAGNQDAGSRPEVMIRSVAVNSPPPLPLRLSGREPDSVRRATVPEDWTPQLLSAVVPKDHPGIDVGIGIGAIRTGQNNVNFTPLWCVVCLHLHFPLGQE